MSHLRWWGKLYILVYKSILRIIYNVYSLLKKSNENKVVFALYRSQELEGNLKCVFDEILKQLPNAKIHLVYGQNKMNLKLFREIVLLADAKYLILDDYYLPVYLIKPKKGLKIIQLWHAAGAFKKFGYSTMGTKFGPSHDYLKYVPIHSNYTHVYVSSKNIVEFYAEAFNMSENYIYPIGLPRVDLFNDIDNIKKIKKDIQLDYPVLQSYVIKVLIAPTYRAKGLYNESSFEIIDTIMEISKNISDNICIIFKPHPYVNEKEIALLAHCNNVLIADTYSINEWMQISDAFVTDYSSAVFEYALLKRPLAHFIPDISEYKYNRGFYEDINVVSDGVVLKNNSQLIHWINARQENEFFDSSRMINYNFDDTKDISKKVVTHFIYDLESGGMNV